ncbi:hypothetical protein ANO11243_055940 [Dothideomycetidae sp. 11243]|nr:hypothetical protein ANO11243_055940 [fungal sp. No.11243]
MATPSPPYTPLRRSSRDYFSAVPIVNADQWAAAAGDAPAVAHDSCQPSPVITQAERAQDVVAIIGIGYVGAHLAESFGKVYKVIAYDINQKRCAEVQQELSHLPVYCTNDPARLAEANHFIIAVTTTLHHDKTVDSKWLQMALQTVGKYASPLSTVIIESSVAVGMTRKLLGPVMRAKNLRGGMSPERVDPGRTNIAYNKIPKIISGLDDVTAGSLNTIASLYKPVFPSLVQVTSPEVAEMTKLYENCQRMVNIAYANEMANACKSLGIDAREVCNAAATKPFGYTPFSPSLGVGGHCIPVNPYYLFSTCDFPLLQTATEMMWARPAQIADDLMKEMLRGRSPSRELPKVLVVGLGFKKGQSVLSNSPGVALAKQLLKAWDVHVEYADPLVDESAVPFLPRLDRERWTKDELESFDMIVVAVAQQGLDMTLLAQLEGVKVENFSPRS